MRASVWKAPGEPHLVASTLQSHPNVAGPFKSNAESDQFRIGFGTDAAEHRFVQSADGGKDVFVHVTAMQANEVVTELLPQPAKRSIARSTEIITGYDDLGIDGTAVAENAAIADTGGVADTDIQALGAVSIAIARDRPRSATSPAAAPGEKPLLFLDFEASSHTEASWPAEIGCAWIADGRVEMRSTIIAPRASSPDDDWSERAALGHGLTFDKLRSGRPAALVAADTDRLRDFLVVSDNPLWEQRWLDRLRATREPIRVHGIWTLVASRLSARAADAFALDLLRSRSPHRAGRAAARLAGAWLAATRDEALAA